MVLKIHEESGRWVVVVVVVTCPVLSEEKKMQFIPLFNLGIDCDRTGMVTVAAGELVNEVCQPVCVERNLGLDRTLTGLSPSSCSALAGRDAKQW